MASPLPHLLLIGTGGTIAMRGGAGPGVTPGLGAADLAAADIKAPYPLHRIDLFAKSSASICLADAGQIVATVAQGMAAGAIGAIVTHGTDTMAETALALALMLPRPSIPVVLTGAMRYAGSPGADGPANLAAAILAASDPAVAMLGEPVVVMADEVHLARWVHKAHAARLHAFSSAPLGPVGWVREGKVTIAQRPASLLPHLPPGAPAPAVPMLLVGSDLEPEAVSPFLSAPIGGLVLAAAGGGHVSARSVAVLGALAARMPVLLASRSTGGVLTGTYGYAGSEIELIGQGLIPAGVWRPEQARILLQLALANGLDRAGIAQRLASLSA